ncbi:hypothetical protein J1P26_16995 [Neobacillus sp. MM2021_6]|uniref:hypothetical protein n=1 Tax=Bacillaceae TaxID=186817 RepID=UPI0014075E17|nr:MULTISPECIES: hypothetical protein [Bacillaceae]MBO0961405.1 hypothetical protein [Neobacillus sp. MM2021_6]NHC20446.1 hypothetical protein [Bacillus sp. MM2020_4]
MLEFDLTHNTEMPSMCSHQPNAGERMEEFIESGSYKHLKIVSSEKEAINKNIYQHLIDSESKRHEIGNNLVAKFIPKKIYHYDYPGLNEYLYDRGLLQKLIKLSSSDLKKNQQMLDLFEPFADTPSYYTKPSFNKVGREFVKIEEHPDLQLTLEEASTRKRHNMICLRKAQKEYETLKREMGFCQKLIAEGKMNHKYGSITRVQKPFIYNPKEIMDKLAIKQLIEYGKPDVGRLMEYVYKGFISKSELESFRQLIDIQLTFVILDLDEEARILQNRK